MGWIKRKAAGVARTVVVAAVQKGGNAQEHGVGHAEQGHNAASTQEYTRVHVSHNVVHACVKAYVHFRDEPRVAVGLREDQRWDVSYYVRAGAACVLTYRLLEDDDIACDTFE